MAHSVEEVVETLARLQLVHGMSAGKCFLTPFIRYSQL